MELLIIKAGSDYVRVRESGYELVGMNKASVFPLSELDHVQKHVQKLVQQGNVEIVLKKLIVTEEEFTP